MGYQDVGSMRDAISEVYRGLAWRQKVSRMSDNQVIAVYYSFLEKGKFEGVKRKPYYIAGETDKKQSNSPDNGCSVGLGTCTDVHQITFDELLRTV